MKGLIELEDGDRDPIAFMVGAVVAIGTDKDGETIITLSEGPDDQLRIKTPYKVALQRLKEAM